MSTKKMTKTKQGCQFEGKVKDILELLGYQVKWDELIAGGQVDLIAHKSDGPLELSFLVECKDESSPVGIRRIRELYARVQAAQASYPGIRGLLISTNGFTKEAKAAAKPLAVQCFSYEELERSLMPVKRYLQWLIEDFEREFKGIYVDLHGEHPKKKPTVHYRPIDAFLDTWLEDETQNHLSILGEYGTGKTTLCRYYAAKLAGQYLNNPVGNRIPILINLREYAKEMNVESLVTNHLINKADIRNASYSVFRCMLEKGLLIVIFDGFDEMAQRTDIDVTWSNFETITQLARQHAKIILTCRKEYFRTRKDESEILLAAAASTNSDVIYLKTLNDDQIKDYLRKRIHKSNWKYYWDQISRIYDLHNLATRPVLLNFIIGHLPTLIKKRKEIKAADLYEVAIDKELKRILRRGRTLIRREDRAKLMQLLAAWMYENNRFLLHFGRIPDVLNIKKHFDIRLQQDIDHHLHDFLTCSFLSKDPDGNYYFSHKSFVDFLVAKKLVDESTHGNPTHWSRYTLNREVARFVGEMASKDQTINNICEWAFDGESELRYNASTAIACMDSAKVLRYVIERKSEIVKHSMLIWALGEIEYQSAKEKKEILGLLNHLVETQIAHTWSWWMAAFAQKKLDETKNPVQMLIRSLENNYRFFFGLKRCFREIGNPRSVVSLLMHKAKYPTVVRNNLVQIMKRFVTREKRPWSEAHNLCWLAGELETVELIPELIELSRHSTTDSTRNIATEALGKIGSVIGKSAFKAVLERLRIVNERYYRTRYHAAEALGKIGKKEAIPELKKALDEEYEPIVRKEIERCIAKLRGGRNS